jgi:hypothetical protein
MSTTVPCPSRSTVMVNGENAVSPGRRRYLKIAGEVIHKTASLGRLFRDRELRGEGSAAPAA